MPPPELEQGITTDRNAAEDRALDSGIVTDVCQVSGMLFHGSGPIPRLRIAVAAQVGENKPVAGAEQSPRRQPHFMICGEGVDQDHCRALLHVVIENLRVTARDTWHERFASRLELIACGRPGRPHRLAAGRWREKFLRHTWLCASGAPAGAGKACGSSGMMIHAMGYASRPTPVMIATNSQMTRTRVTSRSKNSAKPRQT